jgi:small subunit ribosomal protein S20
MKTRVKNVAKSLARAEKEGDREVMQGELDRAKSVIDKAAKKGVIHWRTASRKKSRLAKSINRLIA